MNSVKDFMTKKVVTVKPLTSLVEAARSIVDHGFDGLPVVNDENKLVGIVTQYDLINKGTGNHLPTMQMVLENLKMFEEELPTFHKEVEEISSLVVGDVMNDDPLTFTESTTFEDAVQAFRQHHRVNPVPVINGEHKVVGVVSRFDIINLFKVMPMQ